MFCPSCGADLPAGAAFCPSCGRSAARSAAAAAGPANEYAYAPPAAAYVPPPVAHAPPPVSQGAAVAALLLNVLIWPGLGTLVAGDKKGWAQGFLTLGGVILTLTIIGMIVGIPMMIAAWIWGIVSGVNLLNGKPA